MVSGISGRIDLDGLTRPVNEGEGKDMQEGTGEVRVRVEGEGWGRGPERGQAGTVGGLRQG